MEDKENRKYCVYIHKNKTNGKVYVGKTLDYVRRWRSNGIEYKPKANQKSRPFWDAICEYGWDNFEHIILEENLSDSEACELEIRYIKEFNARDENFGYNIAEGGNYGRIYKEHPRGMLGKKHTEEAKKTMASYSGIGLDWSLHGGHPRGMLGKHHTEEAKERLRSRPSHEHPSAYKTIVIFPSGEVKEFGCVKYAREYLSVSNSLIANLIKTGEPYKLPEVGMSKKKRAERLWIEGIRVLKVGESNVA